MPRPPHGGLPFRCARPKLDSRFVLDVNVLDGTVVAPSAPFSKIWRMRNNGSLVWPHGTQIVWIGGDRFSNSLSADLQVRNYFLSFATSFARFLLLSCTYKSIMLFKLPPTVLS